MGLIALLLRMGLAWMGEQAGIGDVRQRFPRGKEVYAAACVKTVNGGASRRRLPR